MVTVAHLIDSFLPATQGWMYNDIAFNRHCRNIVLCQYPQNLQVFPFQNVYPIHQRYSFAVSFDSLMVRIRAQYRLRPYLGVIAKENPGILHGHFAPISWRHINLVRACGLPLVTTFYGLDVDKMWRRRVWRTRYAKLFDIGKIFICEGPYMASRVRAFGCPEEKIRIVYHAADIERVRRFVKEKIGGSIRVLFIGLARYKKGADDAVRAFIKAAGSIPKLELHLVGDGPYRRKTMRILAQAGMLNRAVYHGYVGIDTYLSLLGQSDILLAPSKTGPDGDTEGGAPVCVIEAMAAGVPVVGTTHCDIPNIIAHGETGLLCAEGDWECLAEHLTMLACDVKKRGEMALSAKEYADKKHTIQRRIAELNKVYTEVIV